MKKSTIVSPKTKPADVPVNPLRAWIKRHPRRFKYAVIAIFTLVVLGLVATKTYAPISLAAPKNNVSMQGPISIKLNQTLQTIDTAKIKITPAVDGAWSYQRGNIINDDRLVFTPKKYFKENTAYKIDLPSASRILGGTAKLPGITFVTEKAPLVDKKNGLGAWQDNQVIAVDASFQTSLEAPNHGTRDLELRLNPSIDVKPTVIDDKIYTWQPSALLPHNTEFSVEVYDRKNNESLVKHTIRTATEPTMTSPLSISAVDENDTINLTFAEPISHSTAKISFNLPGNGNWQSGTMYTFKPERLAPGTTYSYTVASGLRSQAGGMLLADISGSFNTYGPITVTATSPAGSNLAQSQQTISFTFSRPVNQASAIERLSISSGTVAGTSWKGSTLYATVKDIGFQRNFSATIAAGVANTSFGLPSNRAFSLGFTTEARSARLNIPAYLQQHSGTCTAASLRMILSYRGIQADEISIVNQMGYNPRSKDTSTNPPTWDDPEQMFVGSINGSIKDGTGAGPDAPPVAKAARAFGRSATAVRGIGADWIAEQIYAGNPVVMFGSFRNTGMTTWQTPSGGTATMNLTGHATVVTGVVGEPNAPIGFWVNDPLSGSSYWSAGAVAANIARDPYRQAVVVY